jgi:maltose alpha-D-glucosyltransferase/alpha-amylase
MQWNSDRNAGFSKAVPAMLYFPVIMDPIWGYQAINVEAQQSDASSLLHWNRNMIALRKIFQVFGRGTLEFLHPDNRKVLAYIRDYTGDDGHTETVLCVANLSRFAQPVQLDLSKYEGRQPVEMLGYVPFPTIDKSPYAITLAPYSFFWLELQPSAAYAATISDPLTELPPVIAESIPAASPDLASIPSPSAASSKLNPTAATASSIQSLLNESGIDRINQLLPTYIAQQRWFGGKSRTIRSTRIASTLPVAQADAVIAVVEIAYNDNSTDLYQLPLALATETAATALQTSAPRSIIAKLDEGVLFDASASGIFQTALLHQIIDAPPTPAASPSYDATKPPIDADLTATRASALDPVRLADVPSRLSSAEQSNTSILYDSLAILKLFRRLNIGENPDVEITRFLTEAAHFENIPAFLGDLHRSSDSTTLAFLQTFAPNQGDGWAWTLEELSRFYESVASCPPPSTLPPVPSIANPTADLPELLQHTSGYLSAAELLGQRTAELHLALATPTTDPAFAAQPYTAEDLAKDRERIDRQVNSALDALQRSTPTLPPEAAPLAASLFGNKASIIARIQSLNGNARLFGSRIRIHGDYHLGQLLRTQSKSQADFLMVDFEGEPARSLEERRQKQSPLRDVAGMLRSFSYAARSALQTSPHRTEANSANLESWATAWENAASNAFLRGYRSAIAANPCLIPEPAQAQTALLALLLEKAFYELLYELNNRPTWLTIPLAGILSIAKPNS